MSARSDFCAIPSIIYVSGMIKVKIEMCIEFQLPSSNSLGDIDVWKALGRAG